MNVARSKEAVDLAVGRGGNEGIGSLRELLVALRQMDTRMVSRAVDRVFESDVETRPTFSSSWVAPLPPPEAVLIHTYRVGDSEVRLYNLTERAESLYFVVPSEYQLPIHHLKLLHLARDEIRRLAPRSQLKVRFINDVSQTSPSRKRTRSRSCPASVSRAGAPSRRQRPSSRQTWKRSVPVPPSWGVR